MMDTNEQVEPTMKYLGQPTHVDGKPMHTLLPLSSEVYQYGMSVMTKDHYTMCTARSKDEAMKIVQALNRAPAFDAMVNALSDIARQKTTYEHEGDDGDFEEGYDTCIKVARAALSLRRVMHDAA
jgi:hypothetical protein